MSWVRNGVTLLAVIATSASVGLGLTASPALADPPPLQLSLLAPDNTSQGDPFVGEQFYAQSQAIPMPTGRTGWTCAVSFGDGATGGFWRAHDYDLAQPCAEQHSYAVAGTYTISMTVTDPQGHSSSVNRTVQVTRRHVIPLTSGVEGTPVNLTGPGGLVRWQSLSNRCELETPALAPNATVRCAADGTFTITFTGADAATSGAFALTFVNGAPNPTVKPVRLNRRGHQVASPRVGTGDGVVFMVDTRDPSLLPSARTGAGPTGDAVTCRFDFGNGRTETMTADPFTGLCAGHTSYNRPGHHVAHVSVADDSGATATTKTRVLVVRRDVAAFAAGRVQGGLQGFASARLTPRGMHGRVRVTMPDGTRVTMAHVGSLTTTLDGDVNLRGRGRVDGRAGYVVFVELFARGRTALAIQVYLRTRHGEKRVVDGDAPRSKFHTVLRVPVIR